MIIKNIQTSPELANIELGRVSLEYTRHAQEQSVKKRINIRDRDSVNIIKGSVVELELNPSNGKTTKLIVRESYSKSHDIVFVLVFGSSNCLRVKTVWLNHVKDTHKTLKLNRITA